ncbi:hypothetical protein QOT17_013624 [Balamuthia mandrillaris]
MPLQTSLLWIFLVAVTCSLMFVALVDGQTCEKWDRAPSYCTQFEGWRGSDVHIYVPANLTLSLLTETVSIAINVVGALGNDDTLPSRCHQFWARLNCATFLRPCALIRDEETGYTRNCCRVWSETEEELFIETPHQPCHTTCLEYERGSTKSSSDALCRGYLEALGFPFGSGLYLPPGHSVPMTCEELDTTGEAFYQTDIYNITHNNATFPMHCNHLEADGTFLVCEDPLHTVEQRSECGFTCPLPSYTESNYDTLKVLQLVLGWLSWAGSFAVILSYALHHKLRQFPSNLILMAAVAAHAESVGVILPTFFGYDNTWCGFDTAYVVPDISIENRQVVLHFDIEDMSLHSGLCTFQGWLLQMGFLSSTMWWGIVAFNMFLSVFFGKKLPNTKAFTIGLQVVLHVCGWAVPCLLMLIPAAADQITFSPGSTFCSLGYANAYFLTFWALPVGIILFVGTILFISSMIRLLSFARKLKELKKTCGTYFRVTLFILIYLTLISFIFAYSLRVVTAKDTIEDGYSEYYTCLLARQPDCHLSETVHNFGLAVLRSIGYSSLGLMLFLNFCISPSMARFWWRFLQHLREGRFSSMFTSDKTSNTARSPGGTGGKKSRTKSMTTHDRITMSMDEDEEEVIP